MNQVERWLMRAQNTEAVDRPAFVKRDL